MGEVAQRRLSSFQFELIRFLFSILKVPVLDANIFRNHHTIQLSNISNICITADLLLRFEHSCGLNVHCFIRLRSRANETKTKEKKRQTATFTASRFCMRHTEKMMMTFDKTATLKSPWELGSAWCWTDRSAALCLSSSLKSTRLYIFIYSLRSNACAFEMVMIWMDGRKYALGVEAQNILCTMV